MTHSVTLCYCRNDFKHGDVANLKAQFKLLGRRPARWWCLGGDCVAAGLSLYPGSKWDIHGGDRCFGSIRTGRHVMLKLREMNMWPWWSRASWCGIQNEVQLDLTERQTDSKRPTAAQTEQIKRVFLVKCSSNWSPAVWEDKLISHQIHTCRFWCKDQLHLFSLHLGPPPPQIKVSSAATSGPNINTSVT